MTLQGHPRWLILEPIEARMALFLLVLNSRLTLVLSCLSCRVTDMLELLYAESHIFSHPISIPATNLVAPFGVDP